MSRDVGVDGHRTDGQTDGQRPARPEYITPPLSNVDGDMKISTRAKK